jgi:hypothetical protein
VRGVGAGSGGSGMAAAGVAGAASHRTAATNAVRPGRRAGRLMSAPGADHVGVPHVERLPAGSEPAPGRARSTPSQRNRHALIRSPTSLACQAPSSTR